MMELFRRLVLSLSKKESLIPPKISRWSSKNKYGPNNADTSWLDAIMTIVAATIIANNGKYKCTTINTATTRIWRATRAMERI